MVSQSYQSQLSILFEVQLSTRAGKMSVNSSHVWYRKGYSNLVIDIRGAFLYTAAR